MTEFNLKEKRDRIAKRFGMLNGDQIAMLGEVLDIVEEQDKEFIGLLEKGVEKGCHETDIFIVKSIIKKYSGGL